MKTKANFSFSLFIYLFVCVLSNEAAQRELITPPLEIKQNDTFYNYQSVRGVPIGNDLDGADGRLSSIIDNVGASQNPPSENQFSAFISFGAIAAPESSQNLKAKDNDGNDLNYVQNAGNIGLPAGQNVVLSRAIVGAPFLSRPVSFLFGGVIPLPDENEDGKQLDDNVSPESYWRREPHLSNADSDHVDNGYYYSPHADTVFAVQAGPIQITWRKLYPESAEPADSDVAGKWLEDGGNFYRLYTKRYVVSGSAAKDARKVFWNTPAQLYNGPEVSIPLSVVKEIKVVHNSSFPKEVENGVSAGSGSYESGDTNQNSNIVVRKTLWRDGGKLMACNRTGRVFVELLGDPKPDGQTRIHLGFEIVDVVKFSVPSDLRVDLGERITPYQNPDHVDTNSLKPVPVINALSASNTEYALQHAQTPEGNDIYYAVHETANLNDYQIHWMERGLEGIYWPKVHSRYKMEWPRDPSKYSHYIRPAVNSEDDAKMSAVQLPVENNPNLVYWDPLDFKRGDITSDVKYFSWLDDDYPQHRALLKYSVGDKIAFERVFSWLDTHLENEDVARPSVPSGTLVPARELAIWGSSDGSIKDTLYSTNSRDAGGNILPINTNGDLFTKLNLQRTPRIVENIEVSVGDRLSIPLGELSEHQEIGHIAGYIVPGSGSSYNPNAYINPLTSGFEAAALGAIIPVNSIPDENHLEVLWFRRSEIDLEKGFKPVYWPAVKASYNIVWPSNSKRIVLASNDGSGPLEGVLLSGEIYRQPNKGGVGYNPNEEHGIILGGQAYALRDDLNITSGQNYSSEPYVLMEFTDTDGRPSMTAFKVLREDPSAGIVFDYIVEAGSLLQAPMPLPLLSKPTEISNGKIVNYNKENIGEQEPTNWDKLSAEEKANRAHYTKYIYEDRKQNKYVYRGRHDGPPALEAGRYLTDSGTFTNRSEVAVNSGSPFVWHLHASQPASYLKMSFKSGVVPPSWLAVDGLKLTSSAVPNDAVSVAPTGSVTPTPTSVSLIVESLDGKEQQVEVEVFITVNNPADGKPEASQDALDLSYENDKGITVSLINRPPYLAAKPEDSNSFTMQFFYKQKEGFDWPGYPQPPKTNQIVPYLRPVGSDGLFEGDATSKTAEALPIVYRPIWPAETPVMKMSETLVNPVRGLPDIGGQASLRVLYDQAVASSINTEGTITKTAVKLHDPTRFKVKLVDFELPASIMTSRHDGKTFFTKLPPYLIERFFFDPAYQNSNVEPKILGGLVLRGEYKDETLGDDFLLLNKLDTEEVQMLKDLCSASDSLRKSWEGAIDKLETEMVSFHLETENVDGEIVPTGRWVKHGGSTAISSYPNDKTFAPYTAGVSALAEVKSDDVAIDSYALTAVGNGSGYVTLISNDGNNPDFSSLPISLHVIRVGEEMVKGEIKIIESPNPLDEQITFIHSVDLAGEYSEYEYEWYISDSPLPIPNSSADALDPGWVKLDPKKVDGKGEHVFTLGGSGIQSLVDNFITMRYRPTSSNHPNHKQWSGFLDIQSAEGWIKRVLAGINPFNQRTSDLFNNAVNTDVSLVSQAGGRWEGDIALNLDNMNDHGLISIYETVLNRGKALSIDSDINYPKANEALLLAAGYLNDLYMLLGDEALADASNPTIGISTADKNYGDVATSLFAFKGQVPSLLEEELGLLRGRDDFLLPGVEVSPVYNRMFWNYTRGIDSGEVIYAVNYNIKENLAEGEFDGVIDAEDAAKMYPTGHGDAYGHYLSALKNYYHLFMDYDFTWSPRAETALVLGKPVEVDYFDERKFAGAADYLARTGLQVMELTWRKDYLSGSNQGWEHLHSSRSNPNRLYKDGDEELETTRYWGVDHWASRTAIGSYVNWVVGNGMLPAEDLDPTHEGIQKIDRTTVAELGSIVSTASSVQATLDSVEARMTPLNIAKDAVTFDINPNLILGRSGKDVVSHFEQFQSKASSALKNAVTAFDEAKDVTSLMRSEEDELFDLRKKLDLEEFAYTTKLIEIFGSPYAGDVGPGKSYPQGYEGPDLFHWAWVEDFDPIKSVSKPEDDDGNNKWKINKQKLPAEFSDSSLIHFSNTYQETQQTLFGDFQVDKLRSIWSVSKTNDVHYVEYQLGELGYPEKPSNIAGSRRAPGKLQALILDAKKAYFNLEDALDEMQRGMRGMDASVATFRAIEKRQDQIREVKYDNLVAENVIRGIEVANGLFQRVQDRVIDILKIAADFSVDGFPDLAIVGLANGGNFMAPAKLGIGAGFTATMSAIYTQSAIRNGLVDLLRKGVDIGKANREFNEIEQYELDITRLEHVKELIAQLHEVEDLGDGIVIAAKDFQAATEAVSLALWQGERLLEERELFRKRASSVIQGYRTRDATFRNFRTERLERYKSLFDLAATYTYLAAKAYDYETGLLGSEDGENFVERIISSRALGVFKDNEPQFGAGNSGDPGLSSVLAEMNADWLVLKGRLGINNPDTYGTTVSLRSERYRIYPDVTGNNNWVDVLNRAKVTDLRSDPDVMRYCMQVDSGDGLPIPGIVLDFPTTIAEGLNLFGHYLAPGDNTFSTSSFANKIYGIGVAFEGYQGINDPLANNAVVTSTGAQSPTTSVSFMDPNGLASTPYVYLIPVGKDFMRTPPLGDSNNLRSWNVADVSVPLPFNIGASEFSSKRYWQSSDSLSEDLFAVRKHQSFRAVATVDSFQQMTHSMDNYTNNRLIGRSVWNTKWKLVIPGRSLLNDPDEGINRFVNSVTDIKLHFKTYSYSGN